MNDKVAAIRLSGRMLAVAVFTGTHLEHCEVVRLSSDFTAASRRAPAIIRRIVNQFDVRLMAIEQTNGENHRATKLQEIMLEQVRNEETPVWHVTFEELCQHCALPPVRTRQALRNVALSIWPSLTGGKGAKFACDAALLGLFVQTERLLTAIER